MDNVILKKKLSTFQTDKGYLKNVSDDLLYELLVAWEQWPESAKKFYRSIGFSQTQMASLIGKAKKLKREGVFPESNFKEISVLESEEESKIVNFPQNTGSIELVWEDNKIIRFNSVALLLEFLSKFEGVKNGAA